MHVEKLYTGCRWAEGPAWFAAGRYLVWSDIPNDRMLRWDETDGSVSVFRQPAMNSNGHTVDARAGSSRASTAAAASRAPNSTAGARCWPIASTASASIRPTTWWSRRRQHLVHRPELRHRLRLRRRRGAQRDRRLQRLPHRSRERARHRRRRRLRAAERAGVLARRIAAVHRRHRPHAQGGRAAPRAALQGVGRRRSRCPAARCSPRAGAASTTGFASSARQPVAVGWRRRALPRAATAR